MRRAGTLWLFSECSERQPQAVSFNGMHHILLVKETVAVVRNASQLIPSYRNEGCSMNTLDLSGAAVFERNDALLVQHIECLSQAVTVGRSGPGPTFLLLSREGFFDGIREQRARCCIQVLNIGHLIREAELFCHGLEDANVQRITVLESVCHKKLDFLQNALRQFHGARYSTTLGRQRGKSAFRAGLPEVHGATARPAQRAWTSPEVSSRVPQCRPVPSSRSASLPD